MAKGENLPLPYWARVVRQIRESAKLNQMELADLLNTQQANVSRWESGATTPKRELQERLEALATQFGIQSLQGVLFVVRASPFPMLLTDQDGLVVGASASSGFTEGLTVIEQTPPDERNHFAAFQQELAERHFWSSGGNRFDYRFQRDGQTACAVVVSVAVQGIVLAIVQQG